MKKLLVGSEMDRMPGWAFKMMSMMFAFRDFFQDPGHKIDEFGIQPGMMVLDYGCGPGRHVPRAAELTGPTGLVYAMDIQELSIKEVEKRIRKYKLVNVRPMLINELNLIQDKSIDVIYALDMFHMVSDPTDMLKKFHRVIKEHAALFLEDGHQSRQSAKEKVMRSGFWEITEEKPKYMKCSPKKF